MAGFSVLQANRVKQIGKGNGVRRYSRTCLSSFCYPFLETVCDFHQLPLAQRLWWRVKCCG